MKKSRFPVQIFPKPIAWSRKAKKQMRCFIIVIDCFFHEKAKNKSPKSEFNSPSSESDNTGRLPSQHEPMHS